MKAYFLYTATGPLVILTSYDHIESPELIERLESKGITKFAAREVPVDLARERYGRHFEVVIGDLHETDDLRVLDYNGHRAFGRFRFSELGEIVYHEGESRGEEAGADVVDRSRERTPPSVRETPTTPRSSRTPR